MMRKLLFISAFISFSVIHLNAQTISPLPQKADTLSLQQICEYCIYGEGGYAQHPFNPHSLCICYTDCRYDSPKFIELIKKYARDVKFLSIENPSNLLDFIDFSVFTSLQELELYGNDSDKILSIPGDILSIETLKKVKISGIYLDKNTWNGYEGLYPTIEFMGSPQ